MTTEPQKLRLDFPSDPMSIRTGVFQGAQLCPLDAFINNDDNIQQSLQLKEITECISLKSAGKLQVFRAILGSHNLDTGVELAAVCKVGFGKICAKAVKDEALVYHNNLKDLQGTIVPLLYGCYTGHAEDAGVIAVMVMKDMGVPLPRSLRYLPSQIRFDIINGLVAIHKAGVLHGDFENRNIVISEIEVDGVKQFRPTVIDFGEAVIGHECELEREIKLYEPEPDSVDIGCGELLDACVDADIWQPSEIVMFGRFLSVKLATTPEELLEHCVIPDYMSQETAFEVAQRKVSEVKQWHAERTKWDKEPLTLS